MIAKPKKLSAKWPMTDVARELAQAEAEELRAELDDGIKALAPELKDN